MTIECEVVDNVTLSIFNEMLGLDVSPDSEEIQSVPESESIFRSSVEVSGEWSAKMSFQCNEGLAKTIASKMFAMEVDQLEEDEVLDAVGEIINMIGGNIKGCVGVESTLSIPEVVIHQNIASDESGSNRLFSHESGAMMVSLTEANAS